MKKLLLAASFIFLSSPAFAIDDTHILSKIYRCFQEEGVAGKPAEDIAVLALVSLNVIDDQVRIANEKKSLSIYYGPKIVRSYLKPKPDDIDGWAKLSNTIFKSVKQISKKVKKQDFAIVDTIMVEAFKNLNDGSRYESYLDVTDRKKDDGRRNLFHFSSRMIEKFLYVKISDFNDYTKDNLAVALEENPNSEGMIIDLRGNPGGSLTSALKTASVFLNDEVVISTRGHNPNSNNYYVSAWEDASYDKDIVVLVDKDTASAAEVLAVSLQERGLAKVVGTGTYGKGSVQTLYQLPNDSTLALTTAYFYTPSDNLIEGKGVYPNLCTYGVANSFYIKNLIKGNNFKPQSCGKESREKTDIDIDAALLLLKS